MQRYKSIYTEVLGTEFLGFTADALAGFGFQGLHDNRMYEWKHRNGTITLFPFRQNVKIVQDGKSYEIFLEDPKNRNLAKPGTFAGALGRWQANIKAGKYFNE